MFILIAQKKRPGALNTTQKSPALCNVPFLNKSLKKLQKMGFLKKMVNFGSFSWFFQERYIVESWGLLHCIQCMRTLLLSYQKQLSGKKLDFSSRQVMPSTMLLSARWGGQPRPAKGRVLPSSPWPQLGGWHTIAEAQVKKLPSAMARNTGQEELEAETHTWGQLGLLLQRGNAAILNNRVPCFPDPELNGQW